MNILSYKCTIFEIVGKCRQISAKSKALRETEANIREGLPAPLGAGHVSVSTAEATQPFRSSSFYTT